MKRLSDDPAVRLAECRGETVPAFDEAAERVKFEAWHARTYGYIGCTTHCESRREGWLACAKSRAEVK